jgi:hypothetical protein
MTVVTAGPDRTFMLDAAKVRLSPLYQFSAMPLMSADRQGYRVWKFEREEGERSVNFCALSLRSWSGFDVFRPLRDETDPNAIPLCRQMRVKNLQ